MAERRGRNWLGLPKNRTQERIDNNLGIVPASGVGKVKTYRSEDLEKYGKYIESEQYDHLAPWEACDDAGLDYLPIRKRKPLIIYNFAKKLVDTVSSKLVGDSVFPTLAVEGDPDTTAFLGAVMKASKLKSRTIEAVKEMLISGSAFVRFFVINGAYKIEVYKSNYCYPKFDDAGLLTDIEIKYTYCDEESESDDEGKEKKKWFRMVLSQTSDILYDNPEVTGKEPVFTEVSRVEHNLGFVQGEWFRSSDDKHSPDGYSLISDITDFIDSINYSLSQADQAIKYAQEPQGVLSGLDVDDVEKLIRSSSKMWNLGRDGKAQFLEANLSGVERAMELRDKMKTGIADIARVVMLDPEKIVGSAQSGKAMEVLHGPLVELVNEIRPWVEDSLVTLLTKLAVVTLQLHEQGLPIAVSIPPEWGGPQSLAISAVWPPIFPMTMEDLRTKVQIAVQCANASIFSREAMTRWLARDFGIEDIEAELQRVDTQKSLNPFGAF